MTSSILALATGISILCLLTTLPLLDAQREGFGIKLIHRYSPESPFYDPIETHYQRLAKLFRHSISRAKHIHNAISKSDSLSTDQASAEIIAVGGSYVMNFSIGSPPVSTVAIADTGSDVIWTQCAPCDNCFEQDFPIFNPKKSKTYRNVSCESRQCTAVEGSLCEFSGESCLYQAQYGDQSFTKGNVAIETLTLDSGKENGRPVVLPKIVFGCGHENQGTFNTKTSGIVGLGGGAVSLISQLGSSIDGKFSYCLAPLTSTSSSGHSTLNFGANAIVSGSGILSTPLFPGSPETFYFLKLNAVSVGSKKIKYTTDSGSLGSSEGNIIIDSGTTLTLLPESFVSKLVSLVSDSIKATPVADPNGFLNLCYNINDPDVKIPKITVHFEGADVVLEPLNTFIAISDEIMCLTFKDSDVGSIYGNLAQMNFLVGYDREKKTVSFEPKDCEKA